MTLVVAEIARLDQLGTAGEACEGAADVVAAKRDEVVIGRVAFGDGVLIERSGRSRCTYSGYWDALPVHTADLMTRRNVRRESGLRP